MPFRDRAGCVFPRGARAGWHNRKQARSLGGEGGWLSALGGSLLHCLSPSEALRAGCGGSPRWSQHSAEAGRWLRVEGQPGLQSETEDLSEIGWEVRGTGKGGEEEKREGTSRLDVSLRVPRGNAL